MAELRRQQEELEKEMADLMGTKGPAADTNKGGNLSGQLLLEQLRTVLNTREEEKDPNKALLKALLTAQNKTTGSSGMSTLKPEVLSRLSGEREFSMAEWLASLKRQEEGESEIIKLFAKHDDDSDCRSDCRHTNMRSGMLDKATTNIR